MLAVGLADALFLAHSGDAGLAAIIVALTSLSIGLSAGTNAVIAQAIGRDASRGARHRLTLHAMRLSALASTALAAAFWLFAPWVFPLMGARGAVLEEILSFVPFWCLGFVPLVTGMALNAAFRAGGRSGIAATVMLGQAGLNIALDPLFIFGLGPIPAMDTQGAGLATFIARALAFAAITAYALRT